MNVLETPTLNPLKMGQQMKLMTITGRAGMRMPPHHGTSEAVIIVEEGTALLTMPEGNVPLKKGDTFIIPTKKEHTLKIISDFMALAIMAATSKINFI
ncbi:cupin domain-containing protein [Maribacter sp. 2307ULW6-5]|uniref:cupin domain-containing protein n=1 Tax=Maribacter sp. 2307ULW6-5 TaxID=3386275 RepID=UPI0039BC9028